MAEVVIGRVAARLRGVRGQDVGGDPDEVLEGGGDASGQLVVDARDVDRQPAGAEREPQRVPRRAPVRHVPAQDPGLGGRGHPAAPRRSASLTFFGA
jgi:hypothetical protein